MNKVSLQIFGFFFFFLSLFTGANVALAMEIDYVPLSEVQHPDDNPWSEEKERLGKMLFFDPRLSGNNGISCATCHNPSLGWSDGQARALGNRQRKLGRNTPTIMNSVFFTHQFWDGRADTLEEQALVPIIGPTEMDQELVELEEELKSIPVYYRMFKKVFGISGVTSENIAKAIATFERSIISDNSPYDKYRQGDSSFLSKSAVRGMKLFFGKGRCGQCHGGSNFSDNKFHNAGLAPIKGQMPDLGKFKINEDEADKWVFKTPGLRSINRTAPYMHDGRFKTLEEVIEFFDRGGDSVENKSPLIKELGLTRQEKKDLEEFLIALEGESVSTQFPLLP